MHQPADAQQPFDWSATPVDRCSEPYTTWPSSPAAIGAARSDLVRRARDAGASDGVLDDVKLAVSEACTNAVIHAFITEDRRAESFSTAAAVVGDRFEVWIADEGRGVLPVVPNPGAGVGLWLIAQVSLAMTIGTLPDGGTQVRMSFSLNGDPG